MQLSKSKAIATFAIGAAHVLSIKQPLAVKALGLAVLAVDRYNLTLSKPSRSVGTATIYGASVYITGQLYYAYKHKQIKRSLLLGTVSVAATTLVINHKGL